MTCFSCRQQCHNDTGYAGLHCSRYFGQPAIVFITTGGPTVPTRALILLPGYPLLNGYPGTRWQPNLLYSWLSWRLWFDQSRRMALYKCANEVGVSALENWRLILWRHLLGTDLLQSEQSTMAQSVTRCDSHAYHYEALMISGRSSCQHSRILYRWMRPSPGFTFSFYRLYIIVWFHLHPSVWHWITCRLLTCC